MPRVELFPFRYRDPRTGKWVRARYVARLQQIEQRYAEFEITGAPEIRDVDPHSRSFSPHFKVMMSAELRRYGERPPELAARAAIDAIEAFLVRLFLRRYVTHCARRRRFAAMNGAARLYAEMGGTEG